MANPYGVSLEAVDEQQTNPYGISLEPIDAVEPEAEPVEKSWREELGEAGRTVAGGFVRGVGGAVELPLMVGEAIGNRVREIAQAGQIAQAIMLDPVRKQTMNPQDQQALQVFQEATQTPVEPFHEFSSAWSEGTEKAAYQVETGFDLVPVSNDLTDRYLRRGAEYTAMGGIFSKALLNKGARLLGQNVKNPTKMQKWLMDNAKDPKRSMKMELQMNALVAGFGQTAEEFGAGPVGQFTTELAGGLGSGSLIMGMRNLISYASGLAAKGRKKIGEEIVSKYITDLMDQDPKFMEKLQEGTELAAETGVPLSVAEQTRNPELMAAQRALSEDAGTKVLVSEEQKIQKTKEAFPTKETGMAQAEEQSKHLAEIESMQRHVDTLEERALVEAEDIASLSTVEAGETGINMINQAEDLSKGRLDKIYGKIGNPVMPVNRILEGINKAKKTELPGNEWKGEMPAHLEGVLNKLKDTKELSLGGVRELQSQLKQAMREAKAAGKDSLNRSLAIVLESTFDQLDSVKGLGAADVQAMKVANTEAKKHFERFDDARVLLLSRVDAQGLAKTAPEDIIRKVVRPNTATESTRSVEAFFNAVNDPKQARDYLANAFSLILKGSTQTGEALNTKAIQLTLRKYSEFLKTAGLTEMFKDPAKIAKKLDFARRDLSQTISDFSKSELGKFAGTDDVVGFAMSYLNGGKAQKFVMEMEKQGHHAAARGFREALWNGLVRTTETGAPTISGGTSLTPNKLRLILDQRKKDLIVALGSKEYARAKQLVNLIDRITPSKESPGAIAKIHVDTKLTEKIMTGLRAAMHGFVRPDLILAQAGKRGFDAIKTSESKNVLMEALTNRDYFNEVVELSKTKQGREIVRMMFTPLIPASQEYSDQ